MTTKSKSREINCYNLVCPIISAWDLNKLLPSSKLYLVDNAGHSMKENGIPKKLIDLTNELANSSSNL